MNGIVSVWVITWRVVWPAMLVALVVPLIVLAMQRRGAFPSMRAFLLPLVGPLLAVVWAGLFWGSDTGQGDRSIHWASWLFSAIVLGGFVLAIWLPIRFWRAPRRWLLIVHALSSLIFLFGAGFVGSMAITDSWL